MILMSRTTDWSWILTPDRGKIVERILKYQTYVQFHASHREKPWGWRIRWNVRVKLMSALRNKFYIYNSLPWPWRLGPQIKKLFWCWGLGFQTNWKRFHTGCHHASIEGCIDYQQDVHLIPLDTVNLFAVQVEATIENCCSTCLIFKCVASEPNEMNRYFLMDWSQLIERILHWGSSPNYGSNCFIIKRF